MKRKLSKIGELTVPAFLSLSLILTVALSIQSIDNLQGNARVINYIGIIRGGTQRLVKQELNNQSDDALIEELDFILNGLENGCKDRQLIKLKEQKFQSLVIEMKNSWSIIKEEIYKVRKGSPGEQLYALSEDYFTLADDAVSIAEQYVERIVKETSNELIFLNLIFIIIAFSSLIITFYQRQRRDKLLKIENENAIRSEQLQRQQRELLAAMNEISELVYVSDLHNHDVLFINDAGKKIFGVEDYRHLKCYELIQGRTSPCEFCTSPKLEVGKTYSWEYTNPILNKHFLLKDRLIDWQGRVARMEIAFDITVANDEKNELKQRLKRDGVLVECIRELYHNHEIVDALTMVLEQIGKLFSANRVYIFLFQQHRLNNIAEWCAQNTQSMISNYQNASMDQYKPWIDMLERDKNIIIDDIESIKDTLPHDYAVLSKYKIRNFIWVPLEKDGGLNGCIGLDNLTDISDTSDTIIPFLQTLQYFITLAMERYENEKILFKMSYLDELTSFYNRNRYIQMIPELEQSKDSVGVIYLDMNGLKGINDSLGHAAGDFALKECANIIKKSVHTDKLYRIGGDEFVILFTNCSEAMFQENIQRLKNNFLCSQYQIAIGCKWEADGAKIKSAIKEADALMYDDKFKFYQKHQGNNYHI